MNDLVFAFRVAKFVKSNAVVFCKAGMTLGVGAGQMSRVDSTRIAAIKAKNAGLTLRGSVVASDAFFPFRDGLDVVAQAGARAVIQPGVPAYSFVNWAKTVVTGCSLLACQGSLVISNSKERTGRMASNKRSRTTEARLGGLPCWLALSKATIRARNSAS